MFLQLNAEQTGGVSDKQISTSDDPLLRSQSGSTQQLGDCLLLSISTRAAVFSRSSPCSLFGSLSNVTDVLTVSNSRVVKSQLFGSAHEPDAHFCQSSCTYGMVNELTVSFVKKGKKMKGGENDKVKWPV